MTAGFLLWLFLWLYSCVRSCRTSQISDRIFGGEPANITEFPYQLSLESLNETIYFHVCGASIIHPSWAITAAHCVYGYSEAETRLRSGSSYSMRGGTLHYVAKIITHPEYHPHSSPMYDYDVSIIKVSTPFIYSDVAQKIPMSGETPSPGTPAVASGWGYFSSDHKIPDTLQKLTLYIMERERCRRTRVNLRYSVTPRMLCANVPEGGKNIYYGDSGGPLVADNILVGIVSFMVIPEFLQYPSIYIDVAQIRAWATETMKQQESVNRRSFLW